MSPRDNPPAKPVLESGVTPVTSLTVGFFSKLPMLRTIVLRRCIQVNLTIEAGLQGP